MHERNRRLLALALAAAVALPATACGSSNKEAPSGPGSSSQPSSTMNEPSPTNKGAIQAPKAFNPNGNAADGVAALESEGYTVVVQNGGGDPGHRNPLSQCRIVSADGLRGDAPPQNTTVYLTVAC